MYAWEALRAQVATDRDNVSNWVLDYLRGCAERLLALTARPNAVPSSSAIAVALRFKKPGRSGRGNALSDYSSQRRLARLSIAAEVYMLVKDGGHKPDFAAGTVAHKHALHHSTVARHYREHVDVIDQVERQLAFFVERVGLSNVARAIRKRPGRTSND